MAGKFSIKAAGGFPLTSGLTACPVFSGDGRFLAVLMPPTRRIGVWDAVSQTQVVVGKSSFPNPWGLTINHDGSRVAVRSDNRMDVLEVPSGRIIRSIKKKNYAEGDHQQLNAQGNLLFDASNGVEAGFMIWDVDNGKCLERHPFDGESYMVTAISRSRDDRVLVCLNAKAEAEARGMRDELWLHDGQKIERIELDLFACTAAISPDGEKIFVAGQRRPNADAVFRLIDPHGKILVEKEMGSERTFPVRVPHWKPDGTAIAWKAACENTIWLLDAESLELTETWLWSSISVAFGQDDLVAVAGDKGVVLPHRALAQAAEEIGEPAKIMAERRQRAYSRVVELRKASPPRVAIFQHEGKLRIEAERLIGPFRYLPAPEEFCELADSSDLSCIAQAARRALAEFRLVCLDAREAWLWNPAEEAGRLRQSGVSEEMIPQVRYLCGLPPFVNPAVPPGSRYLFLTHHEGLLELWPALATREGEFHERDWPHIVVADTISDEALGQAILDGLRQCTH